MGLRPLAACPGRRRVTMSVDLTLGHGNHSPFPVTWSDRTDKPPSHNCGQFIYLVPITAPEGVSRNTENRGVPRHVIGGMGEKGAAEPGSACVGHPGADQAGQRASATTTRSAWENCPKPQCLQSFSARGWVAGLKYCAHLSTA